MSSFHKGAFVLAVTIAAGACAESTAPSASNSVNTAFSSLLAGYGNTQNSFSISADSMKPWGPGDHDGDGGMMEQHGRHHGPGFGGMGFGMDGGMMGGGLGDVFRGDGFGHGFGFGNLRSGTETHDGLTITRTVTFKDANGNTQQAFDSITTNSINQQVTVSGTVTRHDGATSTVSHQSDRTVSGLARGSTQRTVNGTSAGTENTAGTDSTGAFTVQRSASDTTQNLVVPVSTSTETHPYPTAGIVVRNMKVVVTRAGSTTTSTRREVVTYDGSSTAKVQITQDGTTKQCTVALPHGRLTCS